MQAEQAQVNDEVVDDGPNTKSPQSSEDAISLEELPMESERPRSVIDLLSGMMTISLFLFFLLIMLYLCCFGGGERANFIQRGM